MKSCKWLSLMLAAVLAVPVFAFASCGGTDETEAGDGGNSQGNGGGEVGPQGGGETLSFGERFTLGAPVVTAEGTEYRNVVFRSEPELSEEYTDEKGETKTRYVNLAIDDIYLYVTGVEGGQATLSLRHSSSSNSQSFLGEITGTVEAPQGTGAWVRPFAFSANWPLSVYRFWELRALSGSVQIAEIVFVGRPVDAGASNRTQYLVSAAVHSASPDAGEREEEAAARAEALFDAQPAEIPHTN